MATIWRDNELTLDGLSGKRVCVIGYGSQGRAHALNLRDSGIGVDVLVRHGKSWDAAVSDGFAPVELGQAGDYDVITLMIPEGAHSGVISQISPSLKRGASLVFAHGYTVHYKTADFRNDTNLLLVAPKAIGPRLRGLYEEGKGAAALISAEAGDIEIAKSYAKALGCGRAAVIQSSFKEETETDLFGEQAVLCGGMPALAMAAFDTLVEAGYSPEAAYFECLFEIKLIADLMVERGLAGMFDTISDTAKFGAMTAGERIVTSETRETMRILLQAISNGSFASDLRAEQVEGNTHIKAWLNRIAKHDLQSVGEALTKANGVQE